MKTVTTRVGQTDVESLELLAANPSTATWTPDAWEPVEGDLPTLIVEGVLHYVRQGIPPGGFLRACLANDLSEAAARADSLNRRVLFVIAGWLRDRMPTHLWGSYDVVDAWVAAHQKRLAQVRSFESQSGTEGPESKDEG